MARNRRGSRCLDLLGDLAIDPERRPKDASEVLKLIKQCEWKRRRRPLLILGGVAPAVALLVAGLVVIFGGLLALKNFGRRWITQVLTDNQIVAQTIATEFEARFNDRLKVVREEAADRQWRDLLEPLRRVSLGKGHRGKRCGHNRSSQ